MVLKKKKKITTNGYETIKLSVCVWGKKNKNKKTIHYTEIAKTHL